MTLTMELVLEALGVTTSALQDKLAELQEASVAITTPHMEGTPLATVEAMARETITTLPMVDLRTQAVASVTTLTTELALATPVVTTSALQDELAVLQAG